jgi:DNA (cytosine-5)-methyltransferase 1
MKIMSLFSGVEGLGLGLRAAMGGEMVGFVEEDPFCQLVLRRHYPGVPIWNDVRSVGRDELPDCDVLCGGFPCQDISVAGLGAGIREGTRSGLFFEMWRIALELEPRFVVFENVPAIRRRGLDVVAATIGEAGWILEWRQLSAASCGARHLRNRWFAVAHREGLVMHRDGGTAVGRLVGGRYVTLQEPLFSSAEEVDEMPAHGYAAGRRLYRVEMDQPDPRHNLWPTPRSGKTHGDTVERFLGARAAGVVSTPPLETAVRMMPTPNARDWKDTYSSKEALANRDSHQESLAVRAQNMEGRPGRLNPDWVDVLMGFPSGYTRPDGGAEHGMVCPSAWADGTWEDGIPRLTEETGNRSKRLRALGNSVVPHQAYVIGRYLNGR